jgi:hypothetical protein
MQDPTEAGFERAIAGALRDTIRTHGPITPEWVGSATKRILGNLRNARPRIEETKGERRRRLRKRR